MFLPLARTFRVRASTLTLLAGTALASLTVDPAAAVCTPNLPAAGDTVTCDTSAPNPDTTGVRGQGVPDVTVNVLTGSEVGDGGVTLGGSGQGVIALGDNGEVNHAGSIFASGKNDGISAFDSATVDLLEGSLIESAANAVRVSDNSAVTAAGAIDLLGGGKFGQVGISAGEDSIVSLLASGTIESTSGGIGIATGGSGTVSVAGSIDLSGVATSPFSEPLPNIGVAVQGGSQIVVEGTGSITVDGPEGSHAILGRTSENAVTVEVEAGGTVAASGVASDGIRIDATQSSGGGEGSVPTLGPIADITVAGEVTATGDEGYGIYLTATDTDGSPDVISAIPVTAQPLQGGLVSVSAAMPGPDGPSATVDVLEGGRVFADADEAIGEGISQPPGGNSTPLPIDTTLTVAGEVSRPAPSDVAIALSTGSDIVTLLPTAAVTGIIDGGTADGATFDADTDFDVFNLDGAAGTTATLDLEQSALFNFEQFNKNGEGAWNVVGDTAAATPALFPVDGFVNAGTLFFNANAPTLNATVRTGATLSGTGTLREITVESGGTLAPGNSIGTLSGTGVVTFEGGSIFEVEFAPDGTSDRVTTASSLVINGGTVVPVPTAAEGDYGPTTYLIAQGETRIGTFDAVQDDSPVLDYSLTYDPSSVFLNITIAETFVPVGQGEIHAEVTRGAVAINDEFTELLQALAFRGGAAPGVLSASLNRPDQGIAVLGAAPKTYPADLAVEDIPPTPAASTGPVVWLGAFGGWVDLDGNGTARGYDQETYGLAAGVETTFDRATLGAGLGYSWSDVDNGPEDADIETFHLGVYGSFGAGRLETGFSARGAASYAWHDIDTTRIITVPGVNATAIADYDGESVFADIEARYNFAFDTSFGPSAVSPFVRAQIGGSDLDAFQETGAGVFNATGQGRDYDHSSVAIGVALSGDYELPGGFVWRPSISVAYDRLTGDDDTAANFTLAGASATNVAIAGTDENRNRLRIGSVSEFVLSDSASVTIASDSLRSSDRTDYSFKAGLKLRF